jgi:hypothetical protein
MSCKVFCEIVFKERKIHEKRGEFQNKAVFAACFYFLKRKRRKNPD